MRHRGTPSAYGVELRRLRSRPGHYQSQGALAERAGVSKVEVYNLESGGASVPHVDTHKRLAEHLDLDEKERTAFDVLFDALDRERNRPRSIFPRLPGSEGSNRERPLLLDQAIQTGWIACELLAVVVALVALASHIVTEITPPPGKVVIQPPPLALTGALVVASPVGGQSVVLALALRSGDREQLLPDPTDDAGAEDSWIAPAFAPAQGEFAAIRIDPQGVRSLWEAALIVTSDGHAQIAPGSAHELIANCGICNTVKFSPSGRELLYETADGLRAVNVVTRTIRQVTVGADDAWPACSPDGRWLAYQHDVQHAGGLMVAPSEDCMPIGPSIALAGYGIAWHPAFSPDSTLLAFNGTPGGSGQAHVRVFEVALPPTIPHVQASGSLAFSAATAVSPIGCADPTWMTQLRTPQTLLVYTCGTQLVVEPAGIHPSWHEQVGTAGDLSAQLYNPTWIPPDSPAT